MSLMSEQAEFSESFHDFLFNYNDGYYSDKAITLVGTRQQRINVDYLHFYDYSPDHAMKLLRKDMFLECADLELQKIVNSGVSVHIGWINLPETTLLRDINHLHIGNVIQVKGVVLRVSTSEQVPVETFYECNKCGASVKKKQVRRWISKPEGCEDCGGRQFSLLPRKTVYRERQIIRLFETWDEAGGQDSPRSTTVFLWDDLINSVKPGDRVQLVVIPDLREIEKGDPESRMELFLTVNSVKAMNREDEGNGFTEAEIVEFKSVTTSEGFLDKLSSCISPSIYGNPEVKKAIIMQLVGGVEKRVGGDKKRGEIHILLTGDAGTGKTTLIRAASQLTSRGIFTTGMGSTRAGLTASVSKDKDEGWVLDAGAMVLANGGLMAVDEFDKMRVEDRGAMHTAMESGIVPINKAGINTVLNAKTSVLAACNPKFGRYNNSETLLKNLSDFPETLLSRFDGIFIFTDEGTEKEDRVKAEHVDRSMREPDTLSPPYTEKWVRRFISYSKTVKPVISVDVGKKLIDYYVNMRRAGREASNSVAITQRQQEALYRFTESSARIYLRSEATLEDAENAIETIGFSLKQVGIDPSTGAMDIDALYSGIPKSVGEKLRKIPMMVLKMEKEKVSGDCFTIELREELMLTWKIDYGEAERLIETCVREGVLFRPRSGVLKVP